MASMASATPLRGVQQERSQRERLLKHVERVRSRGDDAPERLFASIAMDGDRPSFEAFQKAVSFLSDRIALGRAYRHIEAFAGNEDLTPDVLDYLVERALRADDLPARELSIDPLKYFGERAFESYRRIVDRSRDASCRSIAIYPLLPGLCSEGSEEALELIFDNSYAASLRDSPTLLGQFDDELLRRVAFERLGDRRTPRDWTVFLIELLGEDRAPEMGKLLEDLLGSRNGWIQAASLRALEARGELSGKERRLESLLGAGEHHVRMEVAAALSRLRPGDESWCEELLALANRRRFPDRMVGASGLAALVASEGEVSKMFEVAAAKLCGLLGDPSWKVRSAVLTGMRRARSHAFLEPLIARLDVEENRMLQDVAETLTALTGRHLGLRSERWLRWYEEYGRAAPLPSLEELAAQARRDESEHNSVATFYSLPVFSDAVCFLLDASASMQEDSQTDKRSRMSEAKWEFYGLFEALPEDSRCNMISFSDEVMAWSPGVRPMTPAARESALEFARKQKAEGGTNLFDALRLALEDDEVDTIYVLSDGEPTRGALVDRAQICTAVAQRNALAQVRIHCISVGRRSALLEQLATDTGGRYHEVGVLKR